MARSTRSRARNARVTSSSSHRRPRGARVRRMVDPRTGRRPRRSVCVSHRVVTWRTRTAVAARLCLNTRSVVLCTAPSTSRPSEKRRNAARCGPGRGPARPVACDPVAAASACTTCTVDAPAGDAGHPTTRVATAIVTDRRRAGRRMNMRIARVSTPRTGAVLPPGAPHDPPSAIRHASVEASAPKHAHGNHPRAWSYAPRGHPSSSAGADG